MLHLFARSVFVHGKKSRLSRESVLSTDFVYCLDCGRRTVSSPFTISDCLELFSAWLVIAVCQDSNVLLTRELPLFMTRAQQGQFTRKKKTLESWHTLTTLNFIVILFMLLAFYFRASISFEFFLYLFISVRYFLTSLYICKDALAPRPSRSVIIFKKAEGLGHYPF